MMFLLIHFTRAVNAATARINNMTAKINAAPAKVDAFAEEVVKVIREDQERPIQDMTFVERQRRVEQHRAAYTMIAAVQLCRIGLPAAAAIGLGLMLAYVVNGVVQP